MWDVVAASFIVENVFNSHKHTDKLAALSLTSEIILKYRFKKNNENMFVEKKSHVIIEKLVVHHTKRMDTTTHTNANRCNKIAMKIQINVDDRLIKSMGLIWAKQKIQLKTIWMEWWYTVYNAHRCKFFTHKINEMPNGQDGFPPTFAHLDFE